MYPNQSSYDNATPPEESPRELLEECISIKIDFGDPDTCAAYTAHCSESADGELLDNVMDAIIVTKATTFRMATDILADFAPDLADMLILLGKHVEAQREAFIQGEAQRLIDGWEAQ